MTHLTERRRLKLRAEAEQDQLWTAGLDWFRVNGLARNVGLLTLQELLMADRPDDLAAAMQGDVWIAEAVHRLASLAIGEIALRAVDDECHVIALKDQENP